MLVCRYIVDCVGEINASALTLAFWLDDENWQFFLLLRRRWRGFFLLLLWVGCLLLLLALRQVCRFVRSEFV